MKKRWMFILFAVAAAASCKQNPGKQEENKVKLSFQPGKNKPVKMNYEFTVNSVTTGNMTHFSIALSGTSDMDDQGDIILMMKNDKIKMDGIIEGKEVNFEAGTNDSIPKDVGRVLIPVFSLLNEKFKTTYDSRLDRIAEVRMKEDRIDSTDNKMQLLLRYPDSAVAV